MTLKILLNTQMICKMFIKILNIFSLLDKIREGEISLDDAKNDQIKFKLDLSEMKKLNKKHITIEKKALFTILKCFTKQETMLLNFIMIIL